MKCAITLEKADLDALYSETGFTLCFPNGQDVILRADQLLPLADMEKAPGAEGFSGARGLIRIPRGRKKLRRGRKSHTEKKETFFRVLKQTGDVKQAYQAAGVSDVTGYKWRKKAGLGGLKRRKTRGSGWRKKYRPESQSQGWFFCRPCNQGFPALGKLEEHQEQRHGVTHRNAPGDTA